MAKQIDRTALTRTGVRVILNKTYKVDGGWISWVMGNGDYPVEIFIPGPDAE